MECHRCQHSRDVKRGKYAETAFELTPCSRCELDDDSQGTREFDESRLSGSVAPEDVAVDPDLSEIDGADTMPVSVLRVMAASLLTLPTNVRDAVCWRLAGWTYREIAEVQNVPASTVEMRQKRAMELCPSLCAVFSRKVLKSKLRGFQVFMEARKQER